VNVGVGCRFAGRCPRVMDRCHVETPELIPVRDEQSGIERRVACHLYD
jgi:ABC-type dipeptide/oligopeptide/nickel transport system ATPase component